MTRNKKQLYPVIYAAGGVISRQTPRGLEILIVHRGRYNDWSLPKGKLDQNESFEDAAVREVKEETGYDARITDFAGCVAYKVKQIQKIVLFWMMETIAEGSFEPSEEVAGIKWIDVPGALELLDYPKEKELIKNIFL